MVRLQNTITMISFRFTLVLCALVFGQSLASTIQQSTAVEGKEIDVIVKIVDALEKLGDFAIRVATKIVDYLLKNVHDLPKKITAKVEEILKALEKDVEEVLEIVKKHANKEAGAVIDCAEADGKVAIVDYASSVKGVLQCVDPNIEKVLVVIPDLVKQLSVILKNVEDKTVNLKKCNGGPLKEIACLLDITKKCLHEAEALPKIVKDAYHKIKAAVSDLISNSKECLHGVLEKTKKDALTRLNNFGTCVRK